VTRCPGRIVVPEGVPLLGPGPVRGREHLAAGGHGESGGDGNACRRRVAPRATAASRPRSNSSWPAASRCCAAVFSASSSCSSCADPTCSIWPDPRREECTTCTAVAPDAVLTVRMYAANQR